MGRLGCNVLGVWAVMMHGGDVNVNSRVVSLYRAGGWGGCLVAYVLAILMHVLVATCHRCTSRCFD